MTQTYNISSLQCDNENSTIVYCWKVKLSLFLFLFSFDLDLEKRFNLLTEVVSSRKTDSIIIIVFCQQILILCLEATVKVTNKITSYVFVKAATTGISCMQANIQKNQIYAASCLPASWQAVLKMFTFVMTSVWTISSRLLQSRTVRGSHH